MEHLEAEKELFKKEPVLRKYFDRMKNAIYGMGDRSIVDLIKLWMTNKVIIGDSDGVEHDNNFKALVNIKGTKTRKKGKYVDLEPIREFAASHKVEMDAVIKHIFNTDLPDMTFKQMKEYLAGWIADGRKALVEQ